MLMVNIEHILPYIVQTKDKDEIKESPLENTVNKETINTDGASELDYLKMISNNYEIPKSNYVEESEYHNRLDSSRNDFTGALDKSLEILPKSLMGGVLGFTYLGSGKMTRRGDLFGDMALMVDVHEAIHTPDEYETRVLTSWILEKEKRKYKN